MFKLYILFLLHVFAHRTRQSNLHKNIKREKWAFVLSLSIFTHFLAFYLLNESHFTTTCTKRVHFSPKRGLKWEINESINATKHIPEDFRQTGWCKLIIEWVIPVSFLKVVHFNLTSNVRSSIHQKVVCFIFIFQFIFILTITRITFFLMCIVAGNLRFVGESKVFGTKIHQQCDWLLHTTQ